MSRISDWNPNRESFDQMRDSLRDGVKAVSASQLFPTPPALAKRVVAAASIEPGDRVLEPSAGTGALLNAILAVVDPDGDAAIEQSDVTAIEINWDVANSLRDRFPSVDVYCLDFLKFGPPDERTHSLGPKGLYDRIVMNPPFAKRQDVRHVTHAMKFLRPGGRLVAIMSAGVTFRDDRMTLEFQALINAHNGTITVIEDGAFKDSGTSVGTVLVTMEG